MSWLSDVFGGSGSSTPPVYSKVQLQEYYDQVKANNPAYYETIKQFDPRYMTIGGAPGAGPPPEPPPEPAPAPAPPPAEVPLTGGPEDALRRLSTALPTGFESQYLPDTLDDPFIASRAAAGRSKADEFINNMIRRGTLTEQGRKSASSLLDAQTPGVTEKLGGYGSTLLGTDRASLTSLANTGRSAAGQTPYGTDYDPTPLVNQIASAGSAASGSFGDRFNASIPAGDLYDVSGLASGSGAVTGPQNVVFDPYAQEGGKLTTGLDPTPTPAKKKQTTAVF